MKPVGKTYLIKAEIPQEEKVGDIFIPQTAASYESVYFIGTVVDYGTGFTSDEKSELLPIGTRVLLDYRKEVSQNKIRLHLDQEIFYVYEPEHILAILEEEEEE
jgi:co-chaperonin GroES (HSP10)